MDHPCTLGATVTKCRRVHFVLNLGQFEFELDILMSENGLDPSGIRTHDIPLESQVR